MESENKNLKLNSQLFGRWYLYLREQRRLSLHEAGELAKINSLQNLPVPPDNPKCELERDNLSSDTIPF